MVVLIHFDQNLILQDRESSLLRKAISKISTEYRFQFAWPNGHISRRDAAGCTSDSPRKSKSLGALKPSAKAIIHRKRIDIGNGKLQCLSATQ